MDEYELDLAGQARLEEYLEWIGAILGSDQRRASFATYFMGLVADGHRKSMEPIASRSRPDPRRVGAEHQRIQQFVTDSNWSDRLVRRAAAAYALQALEARGDVEYWIIDDTGFLKQGKHSVGVKRQYTGSAGKVANCQVGVSLTVATDCDHLPIDFELYLPHDWTDDPMRRREAKIPDEIEFKTKHELALQMIDRAIEDGIPKGRVLADAAYGVSSRFRREVGSVKNFLYGTAV